MSISYSIEASLDTKFSKSTLNAIFTTCAKLGFTFYNFELGKLYEDAPILSAHDAYATALKQKNASYTEGAAWYGTIDGHSMHFWFYEQPDHMEIHIGSFGNIKVAMFTCPTEEFSVDFGWYIKLLVSICEGFKILELHTDTF